MMTRCDRQTEPFIGGVVIHSEEEVISSEEEVIHSIELWMGGGGHSIP